MRDVGLAGGINPYVYAGADPVNRWDPRGLMDYSGECRDENGVAIPCPSDKSKDGATGGSAGGYVYDVPDRTLPPRRPAPLPEVQEFPSYAGARAEIACGRAAGVLPAVVAIDVVGIRSAIHGVRVLASLGKAAMRWLTRRSVTVELAVAEGNTFAAIDGFTPGEAAQLGSQAAGGVLPENGRDFWLGFLPGVASVQTVDATIDKCWNP
jgi:hypothetical protein